MTKAWLMMLRACRACVREMISSIRDGVCVRVAVVVVLMVAVGVVLLVGVLFIGVLEVACSWFFDIFVLGGVFWCRW